MRCVTTAMRGLRHRLGRGVGIVGAAAGLCIGGCAPARAETEPESASPTAQYIQLIKANCHTCHHPANKNESISTLRNLSAAEITTLLFAYKRDEKTATIMNRIAKSLTDEEIPLLGQALAGPATAKQRDKAAP